MSAFRVLQRDEATTGNESRPNEEEREVLRGLFDQQGYIYLPETCIISINESCNTL